jgi:hypothetical protein
MNVVLLRVGIDTGSGGIHGPLFRDGTFEYLPIPDNFKLDGRTYGKTQGRHGRPLVDYFPEPRRTRLAGQPIHFDPEFETFTYGDPTPPKAGLRRLAPDDLLVFYCGLQGWGFESPPALYLLGFFEVRAAGRVADFSAQELEEQFGQNFHIMHPQVFAPQKERLVLVKGSDRSRLFTRAVRISETGQDRTGRPLKVLSGEMREKFGDFGGKVSLQRSPPRWVEPAHIGKAAAFIRSLET